MSYLVLFKSLWKDKESIIIKDNWMVVIGVVDNNFLILCNLCLRVCFVCLWNLLFKDLIELWLFLFIVFVICVLI